MPQGPRGPGGHFWDISEKSKKIQKSDPPGLPASQPAVSVWHTHSCLCVVHTQLSLWYTHSCLCVVHTQLCGRAGGGRRAAGGRANSTPTGVHPTHARLLSRAAIWREFVTPAIWGACRGIRGHARALVGMPGETGACLGRQQCRWAEELIIALDYKTPLRKNPPPNYEFPPFAPP